MSLKAFHIVFVAASVMLCLVLAAWAYGRYQSAGMAADLGWSIGSAAAGVGLIGYGGYFLRKLRNISYL